MRLLLRSILLAVVLAAPCSIFVGCGGGASSAEADKEPPVMDNVPEPAE